jgi:23S rRNA (uracil1939-C5)-methyltransferase
MAKGRIFTPHIGLVPLDFIPVARNSRLFHKGTLLELDILDVAYGGKGIAKVPTEEGDFTVFVPNAIAGQRVRARVSLCKRRHAEARITAVLKRAPEEVEVPYQAIPGAPYITLPLSVQKDQKEKTTLDVYRRIGEVPNIEACYEGWMDSPSGFHYRNKMEYSFAAIGRSPGDDPDAEFTDGFYLGFKARGTWWAVENLDNDSGLFDPALESLMPIVRQWCQATGLPPWHAPKREGFFRFLVVRRSLSEDQFLINLVTTSDGLDGFDAEGFSQLLSTHLGDRLAGYIHTLNDDKGERVETRDGAIHHITGSDHVVEHLHGLAFEIRMRSFFQTNPKCAERLYAQVMAYAYVDPMPEVKAPDPVTMDLFCGTGTIAQLLARHGGAGTNVVGVDLVEEAIADARRSAERNGVTGLDFHAADVGRFLSDHPEYTGRIGTIVLDPPRSGISPKSLRKVIRLRAQRIVYVSCNPATQARDLVTLREAGYQMKAFKLADQFPHTAHVEAVALLEFDAATLPKKDGNPEIAEE